MRHQCANVFLGGIAASLDCSRDAGGLRPDEDFADELQPEERLSAGDREPPAGIDVKRLVPRHLFENIANRSLMAVPPF